MDNFEFFAIQSTTDLYEGNWSIEKISSDPTDLVTSFRVLRISQPNLYFRVVRISLTSEVIVSHDFIFPCKYSYYNASM